MIFYFEFRDDHDIEYYDNSAEPRKFEIEITENSILYGTFLLIEIESPSNDRRLLAQGDSVAELVDWALNNC